MAIASSRYRNYSHVTAEEVECHRWLPIGSDPVAPPTLSCIDNIMEALSHDQRHINIDTRTKSDYTYIIYTCICLFFLNLRHLFKILIL